ncbi:hypothetical protein EUGRSUZ_D02059 [Eucalyptus grandis]|uniref:Uncharacterized protein n=2 Tax=Eucalyptus grandis TaxID=71139 RepID=A0ACC3L7P8_EUCGR|nr:hypothetical protein EUGRSUZ_D02059 [Eucalyptus grandis]
MLDKVILRACLSTLQVLEDMRDDAREQSSTPKSITRYLSSQRSKLKAKFSKDKFISMNHNKFIQLSFSPEFYLGTSPLSWQPPPPLLWVYRTVLLIHTFKIEALAIK